MRYNLRGAVTNFIKHLRETGAFDTPPRLTRGQKQEIIKLGSYVAKMRVSVWARYDRYGDLITLEARAQNEFMDRCDDYFERLAKEDSQPGHTRVIRTTARQDVIRIRDELKAELDIIFNTIESETRTKVLELNKQLNDIETEIYHLRKKARTSSLAPVEDERFSELAYKFAEVYWQRVPFLEDMEHELWMHRAGVEEWLRQKEEYMIITDDARASDASFGLPRF